MSQPFDLAPFARLNHPSPDEIVLEWEEPRDIRRVVATFEGVAPDPAPFHLAYWQRNWPQKDPESLAGTFRGWIGQDDPFHGQWIEPRGACAVQGGALVFEFDPLDMLELPDIGDLEQRPGYLARCRRTLKIRLTLPAGVREPKVSAFSGACQQSFAIRVQLLDGDTAWRPVVSAYNGTVTDISAPSNEHSALLVTGVGTDVPPGSHDGTLVTFRSPSPSPPPPLPEGEGRLEFTVNLADLRAGPLWIRDLGVYITDANDDVPFERYQARCAAAPRQPIYERVEREPEQTYARAVAEIPELDIAGHPPFGRYVILSAEANQQKFALRYNGEVFSDKGLAKLNNRSLERLRWPGRDIHWRIGTGDPPDFRERNRASRQWCEDGCLPVMHTAWQDRDIAYEQVAMAALVDAPMDGWADQRGDEDSVLLMTVSARNTTTSARRCCIWLHVAPDEQLSVDEQGRVLAHGHVLPAQYSPAMMKVARYDAPVLRATFLSGSSHAQPEPSAAEAAGEWKVTALPLGNTAGQGQALPLQSATFANAVLFERWLEPGETATVDIRIPFVSYDRPQDWERLAALDAAHTRSEVTAFWRAHLARGASVQLPVAERVLEDFTRAVPAHIWIGATRDPLTRHVVLPPGTFWYGACGNEAAWQTVALDLFGHHDRARAYLESLIAVQGMLKPDGDFQSAEGALQASDFDQGAPKASHFRYNLDHGTILEGILFHYRITGDQDWLRKIAPNVIAACDFVTRERAATLGRDPRVRGLLPPGHLEDNPEWRYWFAVNAHAHGGMHLAAEALADIGHPEAGRVQADAEAYRADILAAAREARVLSPVVRLLNGVAVPHVPARAELRWREFGWIRETAYGAIHLWDGGLFDSHSPEVTWILQDLEDNLFVNREFGYGINLDDDWFSLGGIAPQPNLMSIDLTYLRRDQVQHALRNFYNNLVYGLYRDVRVLAEWMSEPGLGGGPFYKPSDEARVITWLRHHLVTEEDGVLWLAQGAPRAWHADGQQFGIADAPTFFGRVSYTITSRAAAGEMRARVKLDLRRQPDEVRLRLRHPDAAPLKEASVNGQPAEIDARRETIALPLPESGAGTYEVVARYA